MRQSLAVLLAVSAVVRPAWGVCLGPGDPDCLPDHPLSAPFVAAERKVGCHDVIELDEQGRDLNPPPPSPLGVFARRMGDAAIPFYEAVIARCQVRGPGWRDVAFAALASVGSARTVGILEEHARPEPRDHYAAVSGLLGISSWARPAKVAARLRDEPEASVRRFLGVWLFAHGDETALSALREATNREADPDTAAMLRMASLQIEHPDRCAFVDNEWQWRTLGNECQYFCRGIDYPISTPAWRGLLPCPATVARGHHFRVRATPMLAAIVLIVLGAEMSVSRLEQDCKAPGISQRSERGVSPSLRCLGLRSRSHTSSNGEMPYPC